MTTTQKNNTRLILFHKHPVSAKLHFLYFPYHSVCAGSSLPKLSAILEKDCRHQPMAPQIHPSSIASRAEQDLGLDTGLLQVETEFCEQVEVPDGTITVYLAGISGRHVPSGFLQRHNAREVSLMECVGIAPVEMMLLQKAYHVIMGG